MPLTTLLCMYESTLVGNGRQTHMHRSDMVVWSHVFLTSFTHLQLGLNTPVCVCVCITVCVQVQNLNRLWSSFAATLRRTLLWSVPSSLQRELSALLNSQMDSGNFNH